MNICALPTKEGFLFLGVPQMAIRACLGSKCSSVRITPSRRYGGTIAYRNMHGIGIGDMRGKTRTLAHSSMVRTHGLYPCNSSSTLGVPTVSVADVGSLCLTVNQVHGGSIPL